MKIIREIRMKVDTLINTVQFLKHSREMSLAFTHLQRSKMWLGQVLKHVNEPNPYPESMNAASPIIEPQMEHSNDNLLLDIKNIEDNLRHHDKQYDQQTVRVKFMRNAIDQAYEMLLSEEVTGKLDLIEVTNDVQAGLLTISYQESIKSLIEAKMWLGMELNNIRIHDISHS